MNRERISAHELSRARGVRIVDIRKNPDGRQIPGSQRTDGAALESAAPPFTKGEPVVLYCGSGNSSTRVAASLRSRGYDAIVLDGGYAAWVSAGLPTEKSS